MDCAVDDSGCGCLPASSCASLRLVACEDSLHCSTTTSTQIMTNLMSNLKSHHISSILLPCSTHVHTKRHNKEEESFFYFSAGIKVATLWSHLCCESASPQPEVTSALPLWAGRDSQAFINYVLIKPCCASQRPLYCF